MNDNPHTFYHSNIDGDVLAVRIYQENDIIITWSTVKQFQTYNYELLGLDKSHFACLTGCGDCVDDDYWLSQLTVTQSMRNKGYGSKLIQTLLQILREMFKYTRLLLQDDSENKDKPNNIYLNNGFKVLDNVFKTKVIYL